MMIFGLRISSYTSSLTKQSEINDRFKSTGLLACARGMGLGWSSMGVRRPRMLRGKHVLLGLQSWFRVLGLSGLANLGQVLKSGLGLTVGLWGIVIIWILDC
ncbi:hypothetical protein ES319_A13G118500v1 [Gossypium barbadense]|uniref:Uncharacterized protein n=1 Tax=Gossypium barbadense TaxID=3634 RepID=A0A5J5SY58_GOSBA|nr:hypothetical protein ES319_A13G118500v1 [Gossypium barbadense]